MSFGENIKRLRKDKGWTQAQLSRASGVKSTHIPKIENETTDPKLSTIYKMITALGCSADTLLMDYEKIGTDGIMKATLERAMKLPEENKIIITDVVDKYCIAAGLEASFSKENRTLFRISTEAPTSAISAEKIKGIKKE